MGEGLVLGERVAEVDMKYKLPVTDFMTRSRRFHTATVTKVLGTSILSYADLH